MTIAILKPGNTVPQINAIWAVVSVDAGGEGICAIIIGGVSYPLIAADEQRLKWITEQAELLADVTKTNVKLIKLSERTELRTILGAGS